MVYTTIKKSLKKHFFIISNEWFYNPHTNRYLERFSAKHPLLTPQVIVVNDQAHGFKKVNRRIKSLEKFAIYCELEYLKEMLDTEPDDIIDSEILDSFDLYAEVSIPLSNKVSVLIDLCQKFKPYINVDRLKRIGIENQSSLLIYSNLGDILIERCFEEELDNQIITLKEFSHFINQYFLHFSNFLKICNDILIKKKNIESLDRKLFPHP